MHTLCNLLPGIFVANSGATSFSPKKLLRITPVSGINTPAVSPSDDVIPQQFPALSMVDRCVVYPAGCCTKMVFVLLFGFDPTSLPGAIY